MNFLQYHDSLKVLWLSYGIMTLIRYHDSLMVLWHFYGTMTFFWYYGSLSFHFKAIFTKKQSEVQAKPRDGTYLSSFVGIGSGILLMSGAVQNWVAFFLGAILHPAHKSITRTFAHAAQKSLAILSRALMSHDQMDGPRTWHTCQNYGSKIKNNTHVCLYGEGRPRLDREYFVYGAHKLTDEGGFTSMVVLTTSFFLAFAESGIWTHDLPFRGS